MQNGGEGLPTISLAGRGILVKMFITLEPFIKFYILIHFNIIETQVCKMVTRLGQDFIINPKTLHTLYKK